MLELLSVFLRGKLILLAESFVKILRIGEAAADTDVKQGQIGQEQKPSGIFTAYFEQVSLEGHSECLPEQMGKVIEGKIFARCNIGKQQLFSCMLFNILGDASGPSGIFMEHLGLLMGNEMMRQKLQQREKAGIDQTGAAERKVGTLLEIGKGKGSHIGKQCPVLHIVTGR